ncbi:hypothetical protein [Janthinobacterium sp. CG_S6]|uniref:hypothetical protein n=1 Tax=Janthinobacterium sp. CG_S6 TaxID=3071707 RepID=UPI002DFBB09B|nr:hypothetical protein [Janthinobacterium sp. CG_S6]
MSSFPALFDGNMALSNSERRLVELVSRIQFKRKGNQESAIHDVHVFVTQLLKLAAEYRVHAESVAAQEIARDKFARIAKASKALQEALSECRGLEVELLNEARLRILSLYTPTEDDDVSLGYEIDGPSYGKRAFWLIDEDLRWLGSAAESLSPKRKRGGQIGVAERRVAREFIVLCHEHGWSRITAASSETESKKSSVKESLNAIQCLAAIFVAGGESPIRAKSRARSSLKAAREEGFNYVHPDVYDAEGRMLMESDSSVVNLHRMLRESTGNLSNLPRFSPPE